MSIQVGSPYNNGTLSAGLMKISSRHRNDFKAGSSSLFGVVVRNDQGKNIGPQVETKKIFGIVFL